MKKTLVLVPALVAAVAAQAVSKIAAVPLTAPKEPKALEWEFVEELKLPEKNPAPAAGTHPGDLKEPWLKNRISRCYFSPIKRAPYFRDELTDDVDYYPDAYLERLRNEGVNGLWISGEFRELAETSFNRRDPKGLKRLAKLSRTVAKCKAHGIKVWLFGIEPRCFKPGDPLLKEHPEFGGSTAGWIDWTMMCPSEPNVLKFLEEQTYDIFSHVPDLAGLLLITNGEGMMTCLSCRRVTGEEPYAEHFTCDRCRGKPNWKLHSDTVGAMVKGMRRAAPKAELLSWFYQPASTPNRLEWVAEAAQHLPDGVSLIYNFESGGLKKQAGRWRCGGDYWLSYPGPAQPFRNVASAAKEAGTRIGAKIQTANSHECATVPYIPAPGLIYRKMKAMKEAGVSDVMMCWFFGNYPGIMNRAVGDLAYSDFSETEEEYLARLAKQTWGDAAPVMARLWKDFTDGYSEYPFSNVMQYSGPFHNGIAWPLLARVECDRMSHTWIPGEPPSGDMVCESLRDFTIDEAALLARTMADKCSGVAADGTDMLEVLSAKYAGDRERLRDLGVMKTLRALFRSGADIFRFYRMRSEAIFRSRVCGDARAARAALREMREIVAAERENTRAVIPLAKADSRIGFHSEAQDYKFWPALLEWRLGTLDATAADIDAIDAAIARGEPYPESEFERDAPYVSVGGAETVTTNVSFRLEKRPNGDLAVVGRARAHVPNLAFGAFDAACVKHPTHAYVPRPGSGEKVVYLPGATDEISASAAPAENGEWTFEVVFRAAAWNNDDRLRPGWFAIITDAMPQTHNGKWLWPESGERVYCRLCLPWLWGRYYGRIKWPDTAAPRAKGDVKIENARMSLTVGGDAVVKSLVVKATGEEMLSSREPVPLVTVTQDRFFHNEIKLAYPCGEVTCRANRISREGDMLRVGFELLPYDALIRVKETDDFVSFELAGFSIRESAYASYKVKMPPVKSLRIMQLPVKPRRNFGEWLNVMWDDRSAVAVLAPDAFMRIGSERRGGCRLFSADLDESLRLEGGKAVLVAASGKDDFLSCLDAMEAAFDLPRGVRDRQSDVFNSSVFWTADVTPENVDEQIAIARRGGFRMMLIYHTAFCTSPGDYLEGDIGDYAMRPEYPKGLESLREMLAKIKAAGIRPGIHLLHPFIGFNSKKYISPVADHRLNLKRHFTVAKDLGVDGGDLYVEEDPSSCPRVPEARLLRFEGELLSYEGFTTERPYKFTGVRRGAKGTRVVPLPKGRIGGLLDVAEGGGNSCYVDQNSSLQDELCDRFAEFWSCGFEFLCLDGCEGVNAPCQVHVANGQYRVWKKLDPKPLFTEGAAKAHFAWHHLSGANAFDVFCPEIFKAMIVKWPLAEAEMMRREFSRVSFGWWGIWLPGEKVTVAGRPGQVDTVGTQMDMWEFGTSRAAAWDSPTTIQFSWDNLAKVKKHPRMADLLEVMRRWEDVRARKWLTPSQKEELKSPTRQHHLYLNERGEYELHEIEMLVPEDAAGLRAFLFERGGRRVIAYWHTSGSGDFELPLGDAGENVTLHAEGVKYFETALPREAVRKAFGR